MKSLTKFFKYLMSFFKPKEREPTKIEALDGELYYSNLKEIASNNVNNLLAAVNRVEESRKQIFHDPNSLSNNYITFPVFQELAGIGPKIKKKTVKKKAKKKTTKKNVKPKRKVKKDDK